MPNKTKSCSGNYPLGIKRGSKLILAGNIRFVQRDVLLSGYAPLFRKIANNAKKVCLELKCKDRKSDINFIKLMKMVVPIEFFGTEKHRHLFHKVVKLILSQSHNEFIHVRQIIKGYNLSCIPWLKPISQKNMSELHKKLQVRRYFYEALLWLLEKIVKPLILRFYCIIKTGQIYELEFVPRKSWLEFQKNVVNNLKIKKHISLAFFQPSNVRGILRLKPKSGYQNYAQFRPIMVITRRLKTLGQYDVRAVNKLLRMAATKMCLTKTGNLFQYWKQYVGITGNQDIFGVRLDIEDAFGNINIDHLCYILELQCVSGMIPRSVKAALVKYIQKQFLRFGKIKKGTMGAGNIYQWNHGILQGDHFSSALCQLYLSHYDQKHLKQLCNSNTFLHRTVDDYLFCSTNPEDIEKFISIMGLVHKLNVRKTESNLPKYGQKEIPYCGRIIDLSTKEIRGLYDFKPHTQLRHRFKLWNVARLDFGKPDYIERFLMNPMAYFSNQYHFKNLELNTVYNRLQTVAINYFHAMIYLAYKFDTVVMAIYERIKDFSLVKQRAIKVVHKFSRKAMATLKENQGQFNSADLTFEVLLKIGFQAFILVLKKRLLYQKHSITTHLLKYMNRIRLKKYMEIIIQLYCQKVPTCFNNISLQRRLPHQYL